MLRAGQLERAATLCASYLGRRPELWQRWIRAFGAAGALPQLAPHVPLSNPQLPHETYEQALAAAITPPAAIAAGAGGGTSAGAVAGGPNDPGAGAIAGGPNDPGAGAVAGGPNDPGARAGAVAGGPNDPGAHLLLLLRRWPSSVYRPAVVQRAVLDIARRLPGGLLAQPRLMESMALLHCHAKQHEAALHTVESKYVRCHTKNSTHVCPGSPGVFLPVRCARAPFSTYRYLKMECYTILDCRGARSCGAASFQNGSGWGELLRSQHELTVQH